MFHNNKKLNKILSDVELGDRKPSQLLNEMRHLGPDVDDSILKTLWVQRMPVHIRTGLSITISIFGGRFNCFATDKYSDFVAQGFSS